MTNHLLEKFSASLLENTSFNIFNKFDSIYSDPFLKLSKKEIITKLNQDNTLNINYWEKNGEKIYRVHSYQNIEQLTLFLELGMNVNSLNELGENALFQRLVFTEKGQDKMNWLLDNGIDVNVISKSGNNVLEFYMTFSIDANFTLLEKLLKSGLNVNIKNAEGDNILQHKFSTRLHNDINFLELIKKYGMNFSDSTHKWVLNSEVVFFDFMKKQNPSFNVNVVDDYSKNALWYSLENPEKIQKLIQENINLQHKNDEQKNIVESLLIKKQTTNTPSLTQKGNHPFMIVTQSLDDFLSEKQKADKILRKIKSLKLIIDAGIDLHSFKQTFELADVNYLPVVSYIEKVLIERTVNETTVKNYNVKKRI